MTLDWLEFDYSEDGDGHGSFDAMASASPGQLAALRAEVLRVLQWARQSFPAGPAPLEEGSDWDCELQAVEEVATTLDADLDLARDSLELHRGTTGAPRVTLSLTVSGTAAFCDAFRAAFGID